MVRLKSTHGFTLIEVMVVAAIIGIMAMIAIPSYRTWFPRHQLRSAKEDVVADMQLGRMRAISSGHVFYLDFDPDNNSPVLCFIVRLLMGASSVCGSTLPSP